MLLDLRASLVASLNFPLDAASFETSYPEASLQSLNTFDPLLYKVCLSCRVLTRLLTYREGNRNCDSGLLECLQRFQSIRALQLL